MNKTSMFATAFFTLEWLDDPADPTEWSHSFCRDYDAKVTLLVVGVGEDEICETMYQALAANYINCEFGNNIREGARWTEQTLERDNAARTYHLINNEVPNFRLTIRFELNTQPD